MANKGKNKIINRTKIRTNLDLFFKCITALFSFFGITALLLMFAFILKEAFPAYRDYGIFTLYLTADYSDGTYGMLGGLSLTVISSLLAVLIALPIAIRCAFFIHFRMRVGKKIFTTIINVLASIPSVLFGIFAFYSLSKFTNGVFGTSSGQTLINGIIMLAIMILPILISMIIGQLKMLPKNFVDSSLALGNSKTYAIYTIVKKEIRPGVVVATIIALGRAIGETMALSLLLTSIPGDTAFPKGFFGAFLENTMTLGVVIGKTFFDDVGGSKSHLFAASILLFVVVMILVSIASRVATKKRFNSIHPTDRIKNLLNSKENEFKFLRFAKLTWQFIIYPFSFISFTTQQAWSRFIYYYKIIIYYATLPLTKRIYPTFNDDQPSKYYTQFVRSKISVGFDGARIVIETLASLLLCGFTLWLVIDILSNGLPLWTTNDWQYSYFKPGAATSSPGSIANRLAFTVLLILAVIAISFPIAFLGAVYLTEYANNKRHARIIRFFLDSLGGTPSILFGIFGSIFFIQTLNLRIGKIPYSFIAGALTMVLVVIPTFTRSMEQTLLKVPKSYRYASLALGASKVKTIFKVIFPQSLPGVITGIILTSGRIIAETAPVYLTFGSILTAGEIGWLQPGHTLTTGILATFWTNPDFDVQRQVGYKLGSAAIFLSILITITAESIVPIFAKNPISKIKHFFSNKKFFSRKVAKNG